MMNDIQKKFEDWKVEREVNQYNETGKYREGYVKAMCDAINLVKNLVIPRVTNCTVEDLNIGDIVLIEHAHQFKDGYWSVWSKTNYKYLGCASGLHKFENINHPEEHFTYYGDEPMNKFVGRYCL